MSFRDATKSKDRELDKQHELQVARTREEEEIRARAQSKARTPDLKVPEGDIERTEKEVEPQRPPTVGVRGVARQDGVPAEGLCRTFLLIYVCSVFEPCSNIISTLVPFLLLFHNLALLLKTIYVLVDARGIPHCLQLHGFSR